jgi:CheY-like chemotaxis protein
LLNLVGNAVKFTDKGSIKVRATIDMASQNEFMRVDVMDTGIGIAEENIDRIFERFKQVDASVSRRYGGSGLGLAISTRIVAMMGGEIKVSSVLGKGSVFTVLVPMQLAQSVAPPAANTNEQARGKVETANHSGGKVLIVEDYEGNIVVVSYILDDMGCAYDIARNGVEALEKWNDAQYDVILMDVQMPKMDGFEATKRIRQTENTKGLFRTPIIGMTAHALVGDKDKCIEAGMDAYFPKPIVESDLRKKINEYLSKKEAA